MSSTMGTATMDPVTMDPSHGMDMNSTDGTMVHHMMMMMPMYFTLDFPDVFLLEQWKITKDWREFPSFLILQLSCKLLLLLLQRENEGSL